MCAVLAADLVDEVLRVVLVQRLLAVDDAPEVRVHQLLHQVPAARKENEKSISKTGRKQRAQTERKQGKRNEHRAYTSSRAAPSGGLTISSNRTTWANTPARFQARQTAEWHGGEVGTKRGAYIRVVQMLQDCDLAENAMAVAEVSPCSTYFLDGNLGVGAGIFGRTAAIARKNMRPGSKRKHREKRKSQRQKPPTRLCDNLRTETRENKTHMTTPYAPLPSIFSKVKCLSITNFTRWWRLATSNACKAGQTCWRGGSAANSRCASLVLPSEKKNAFMCCL